jgi:putative oxidoreductase
MAYGLLLIRAVFGLSIAAHGGQKLFGWFGGWGLSKTAAGFRPLRYRAPLLMALVASVSEEPAACSSLSGWPRRSQRF